ncbi:UNVERIFIED_CONTAM: hypothetical protein FKN15_025977 [Acipenser sinensis]
MELRLTEKNGMRPFFMPMWLPVFVPPPEPDPDFDDMFALEGEPKPVAPLAAHFRRSQRPNLGTPEAHQGDTYWFHVGD